LDIGVVVHLIPSVSLVLKRMPYMSKRVS